MANTKEVEGQVSNRRLTNVPVKDISKYENKSVVDAHMALLQSGDDSDVTFIVGPSQDQIPSHQLFLKVRSPVFQAMFSPRWNQAQSYNKKEISIPDTSLEIFWMFLEFIYTDGFSATVGEALDLIHLAHMYDVGPLVRDCEELLKRELKPENAVAVFQSARKYGRTELIEKSGNLLAKSMQAVVKDGSLLAADEDTLIYLLSREDLKVKEIELFKIALKWGEHRIRSGAVTTLEQALRNIVPLIRFPLMTPSEFTSVVVPTHLLPDSTMVQIFTYFASDVRTRANLATLLPFCVRSRGKCLVIPFYLDLSTTTGSLDSLASNGLSSEILSQYLVELISFTVDSTSADQRFSRYRATPSAQIRFASPWDSGFPNNCRETSEFAIIGITLACPVRQQVSDRRQVHAYDEDHRGFKIAILKHEPRMSSYPTGVFSTTVADLDWGSEMEVQVDPPVRLKKDTSYIIQLQELECRMYAETVYRGENCRQLSSTARAELPGSSICVLRNIRRNDEGYNSGYDYVRKASRSSRETWGLQIIQGIRVNRVADDESN